MLFIGDLHLMLSGKYCTFTVLDIKVYYYPQNGNLLTNEYYHSEGSNKPDIQHSKSAILYSLYACIQNRVRTLRAETMHSPKTALSCQQRKATKPGLRLHAFQNIGAACESCRHQTCRLFMFASKCSGLVSTFTLEQQHQVNI